MVGHLLRGIKHARRFGIFICMELMKTEKHQNQHLPLSLYLEKESIVKRPVK